LKAEEIHLRLLCLGAGATFLKTFDALAALSAREGVQSGNNEQMNRMRELVVSLQGNNRLSIDGTAVA
jgi:hypothetical protein